jgi:hypothetical protein
VTTKTLTITAIHDVPADNGETVLVNLAAGPSSGAGVYTIGAPSTGTVTITDNSAPVIGAIVNEAVARP